MEDRKPSPKPSPHAYVPPHRRHYPRTESVHYQSSKRQKSVPPTHESYEDTLYSPGQEGPTNVTPGTKASRQSSTKISHPISSIGPTSPRYTSPHVETATPCVPTDPPTSVTFDLTSYSQASPGELLKDDSSEDTNDLTPVEMTIPPIGILTSTYYAWLQETFPAIATEQFHDFFDKDILPLTLEQLKIVFNYDPKGLIKYIGLKNALEYYPVLVELLCIWHTT